MTVIAALAWQFFPECLAQMEKVTNGDPRARTFNFQNLDPTTEACIVEGVSGNHQQIPLLKWQAKKAALAPSLGEIDSFRFSLPRPYLLDSYAAPRQCSNTVRHTDVPSHEAHVVADSYQTLSLSP